MNTDAEVNAVAVSEKFFRRLLTAYPPAHREEYGAAMAQLFRDQCRDAWGESRHWGLAKLWLRVLPDVVGTSFIEHLETIKERKFMLNRIGTAFRSAQFFTVFTAVFLLVVVTATVITFILPESFVGTARISVGKAQDSSNAGAKPGQPIGGSYDPYFIQTELETMRSQSQLGKVVENPKLNLKQRWATKYHSGEPLKTQEAIELLRHFVSINQLRNTSLIEINVYSDKPEEAAELANAIADAYKEYRLGRTSEKMMAGIKMLNESMEKKVKEIHDAQTEVDRLRLELRVSDPDPASTGPSPTFSSAGLQQLMSEVARAKGEATQLKTQLDSLAELSKKELRGVIQIVVEPDPVLSTLINELDAAEQRLLNIANTKTVEHPDYQSGRKVVQGYNTKIDERVAGLLSGLQMRLASKTAYISNQTRELDEAKKTDIEEATRTRSYWAAKTGLTGLYQFRNALQMKIAAMATDVALPQDTMVEITDRASPNLAPVRPNKPLNITIGVILGIALGLLAGGGVAGISFWRRQSAAPKIAT